MKLPLSMKKSTWRLYTNGTYHLTNKRAEPKNHQSTTFQYVDGDNKMRVVGDILARYVYWIKGENDKNIPMECLSFDRNSERFNNVDKDWVREYYPDLKCGWSYATQCIDRR